MMLGIVQVYMCASVHSMVYTSPHCYKTVDIIKHVYEYITERNCTTLSVVDVKLDRIKLFPFVSFPICFTRTWLIHQIGMHNSSNCASHNSSSADDLGTLLLTSTDLISFDNREALKCIFNKFYPYWNHIPTGCLFYLALFRSANSVSSEQTLNIERGVHTASTVQGMSLTHKVVWL